MNESYADKIKKLCSLVETNGLAEADLEKLNAHLEKLDQPICVSVFGNDSVPVSNLVNFLLAERILPKEGRSGLPIRIQYAKTPVIQAKLSTGESKRYELEALPSVFDVARHVTIGAPLSVLRKISIVQYAQKSGEKLCLAAKKSTSTTDVIFLCADGFGPEEEKFWMSLPENLRDRGYLLCPSTAEVSARATQILGGVLRADIEAAMKLREAPGGLDRKAFQQTGGMDLVATMRREIEWREQAIFDAATVLIHRSSDPKLGPKGDATHEAKSQKVARRPEDDTFDVVTNDAPTKQAVEGLDTNQTAPMAKNGEARADAMPSDAIGRVNPKRPVERQGQAVLPPRKDSLSDIKLPSRHAAR